MQADVLLGSTKKFDNLALGVPDTTLLGKQAYSGLAVFGTVENQFAHVFVNSWPVFFIKSSV